MRHLSLAVTVLTVACVTNNTASTAQDPPLAMFAGGSAATGSTTGASTVTPPTCVAQEVTAGANLPVDLASLTENADGNPITATDRTRVMVVGTNLEAAAAISKCEDNGSHWWEEADVAFSHVAHPLDAPVIEGEWLPDGGATAVVVWNTDWSPTDVLIVLLLPNSASEEGSLAITPDMWAR